jgi:long-chain acyl-CoA synthetase
MTLGEMLERSAGQYPDKTALVYKGLRLSYRELNIRANKLARALVALGIKAGEDKVGILLPNCTEFVISMFGVFKSGAAVVPLNILLKGDELAYIINHSDAKIIITGPPYDQLLSLILPKLPQLKEVISLSEEGDYLSFSEILEQESGENYKPQIGLEDIAAIYYTSGTTGLPKGAMLTHVNLLTNVVAIGTALNASRKDIPLCCVPMFHALAVTGTVLTPIFGGMTLVILDHFLPQPVLQAIQDEKVTIFVGVPTMYAILANMPHLDRYDLSSLRLCFCGGAPLTKAIVEKFESKFPAKIYEGYGLSETSPLVSVNPLHKRKIGSIGKVVSRVEWKLVDEKGQEVPPGKVGEIIVRGMNVMKGYYKDPEATRKAIRDGWLYTGDMGRMDSEGYVYIVDRKKDMIIVGGENVYPREIEEVIYTYPGVLEAAVIGIPDPVKGEIPKAFVVPKPGARLDEQKLLAFCREKLAAFKVPRSVEILDELPKTATGKIWKRKLRDMEAGIDEDSLDEEEVEEVEGVEDVTELSVEELESVEEAEELASNGEEFAEIVETEPDLFDQVAQEIKKPQNKENYDLTSTGSQPNPGSTSPKLSGEGQDLATLMAQLEGRLPKSATVETSSQRTLESGLGLSQSSTLSLSKDSKVEEEAGELGLAGFSYEEKLKYLVTTTPGGIAAGVTGEDGIGIASFNTNPDFDLAVADAELASMVSLAKKTSDSLGIGKPQELIFMMEQATIIIRLIGDKYFLAFTAETKELNLGLARVQMNKVIPLFEKELYF